MEYDLIEECDFFPEELEKDEDIPLPLPEEISFISEVHSIMHACGDVKNPLESSAKLMYNILQDQMALLIKNAEDIMKLKKGKRISHEELLFLMRKNKVLLKRLLLFLFVEDAKSCLLPSTKRMNDGFSPEKGERVSRCLKYLSFIEKFTGDLTFILRDESIVDHVYMKRLKRRDLMAESMTAEEYESFFEYTLKLSFCQKYTTEIFKTWLQQCSCSTTDITLLALSIIHFLARETIAVVVDKALEIKSRTHKENDNFPIENFSNSVDLCCKPKHDFDESENKLQLPLSQVSEDSSYNIKYSTCTSIENKIDKNNINSVQNCMQETNLFSSTSHGTCDIVKCPAPRDTQEKNMIIENSIIDNSLNDIQMKKTAKLLSQSDQKTCANSKSDFNFDAPISKRKAKIPPHSRKKSSSKNCENCKTEDAPISKRKAKISSNSCKKSSSKFCANSKSTNVPSSNKNLHDNVRKSETNCVVHDNSESDNKFSNTCNAICEDASKKIKEEFYFSVNFQAKPLSICCDGSKTFEISTSLPAETDRFNKTTDIEDKDWATSCFMEYIEEPVLNSSMTENSASRSVTDFGEHTEHFLFTTPIKMDYQVYWFPEEPLLERQQCPLEWWAKNLEVFPNLSQLAKKYLSAPGSTIYRDYFQKQAITPEEIQAAFIYYQHSLPMSYLMKTKLPVPPRKLNLVCLADPDKLM